MGIWVSKNSVASRHNVSNWLVEVSGGLVAINMLRSTHDEAGDNQDTKSGQRIVDEVSRPARSLTRNGCDHRDKKCARAQGRAVVATRDRGRPGSQEGEQ